MRNLEIKNIVCHAALAMTKNAQSGRSMIEMLGVLAIIGVLSVGGIAGYSKAMMKYRINKTIEQITLIAGNIRAFWGPQKNYEGVDCHGGNCSASGCNGQSSGDGCPIVKKAKILPDEMITVTDGKIMSITNPFGGGVSLYGYNTSSFEIRLSNIPKEACIELSLQDWSINSGAVMIDIYEGCDYRAYAPIDDLETLTRLCESMEAEYSSGYFSLMFYSNKNISSGNHSFEEDC